MLPDDDLPVKKRRLVSDAAVAAVERQADDSNVIRNDADERVATSSQLIIHDDA